MTEVEVACSASTREMKATCTTAVRKAEAARVVQTSKLWQTYLEAMQALEDEAFEEERHSHQSFLWACGAALQACCHKVLGILMYPLHSLTGNMSLTGLLTAAPQLPISSRDPISSPSCSRPATATHPTGNKWQHMPRCEVELDCSRDGETTSCPGEPPQWRWREEDPLSEILRGACREAFSKDSDLVKHIRWTYFRAHLLVFLKEVIHDLADIFGEMTKMLVLMGSEIHPIQDQWQGKKELHVANHVAKGSTKNLCYFWVVSPIKSPKIMGLKGIHSLEALKHQACLSFCPWCGKEGQNEGIMVNHLCTRHYYLRLVCEQCLQHFMTPSDRLWHHSQGCKSMHVCNDEELDWPQWLNMAESQTDLISDTHKSNC